MNKNKDILTLFDSQIELMKKKNFSSFIIREFQNQKEMVLETSQRINNNKNFLVGEVMFLPVISFDVLSLAEQASLITYMDKHRGITFFNKRDIKDINPKKEKFYYIFGINENNIYFPYKTENSQSVYLDLKECISLAIFCDCSLMRSFLISKGSIHRETSDHFGIVLHEGHIPVVTLAYSQDRYCTWGNPTSFDIQMKEECREVKEKEEKKC